MSTYPQCPMAKWLGPRRPSEGSYKQRNNVGGDEVLESLRFKVMWADLRLADRVRVARGADRHRGLLAAVESDKRL